MNILQILKKIKELSLDHEMVHQAEIGDVYTAINNSPDIKYSLITTDITDVTRDDIGLTYTVYLYYIDRTLQDNSNVKQIQSDAVTVLQSIINETEDALEGEVDNYTITLFEQKFNDYCAGAWAQFSLILESDLGECSMEE